MTGQPILARRWVLGPQDLYEWAYCPIAVNALGQELPFAPDSCDVDPGSLTDVVELSYFGRLSAGRTKERNIRMHFNEVIEKIKMSDVVTRDEVGRLKLGTGCTLLPTTPESASCAQWDIVDSPQENLALYHRMMKYGHLQTRPDEIDIWAHGDPATMPQYHVALAAEDWAKFIEEAEHLLPYAPANPANAAACFAGLTTCAAPQVLSNADFAIAAGFLGTAADKHGRVTVDLVAYVNRILRITCGDTEATKGWCTSPTATAVNPGNLIPALIRDCYVGTDLTSNCQIYPATTESVFPANERFINYGALLRPGKSKASAVTYDRLDWFNRSISVLMPVPGTTGTQWTIGSVYLPLWLTYSNPTGAEATNIRAFVGAANDAVRAVQFVHEYEAPSDLGYFPY